MRIVATTLAGILAAANSFSQETVETSQPAGYVLPERGLCAHRGAMTTHPENTLAAFQEAIRHGVHMIEFDVWLTKDGELVVIHDATLDRTTNGAGRVADHTLADIRELDAGAWKSPMFAGERVPTLREALRILPWNVWLNVHLKEGEELGRRAAQVIADEGRLHQAFLACSADAARGAQAVVPDILICNMDRQADTWDYVRETIASGADFIQLLGRITPAFADYAAELKKNGVRINYYGTDDPEELRALFELGIDFPLVDDIGGSMAVAVEMGIAPVSPALPGLDATPPSAGDAR